MSERVSGKPSHHPLHSSSACCPEWSWLQACSVFECSCAILRPKKPICTDLKPDTISMSLPVARDNVEASLSRLSSPHPGQPPSFCKMHIVRTVEELRRALADSSRPHSSRALVPTMGNLHAGHLSLVRIARQHADFVVVSIFVNRLQFEPHGDFDRYPRTLDVDARKLDETGFVDLLFVPDEREMYPEPQEFRVQPPPVLGQILEGEKRPGFFEGVCTVVMKLFSMVQPTIAIFGRKDYQQLLIVRRMVAQFNMPLRIVEAEIAREPDGLAMSSRNGYLSEDQRREAPHFHRILTDLRDRLLATPNPQFESLELEASDALRKRGWTPFYIAIRDGRDLTEPSGDSKENLVILAAAQLGSVRLLDNLKVSK